jgi:hypothetical protein
MDAWQRLLLGVLIGCALACGLACASPVRALASGTQETLMMDDDALIYDSPSHVSRTLQQMATLGVDRVKVSVVWSLVAPDSTSKTAPEFDAADPAAYPAGAWNRYDALVKLAAANRIGVYFQLTAPAPSWAVAPGKPTQGYPWSQEPNPSDFNEFVQAVGTRYSGTYVPPSSSPPPSSGNPIGGLPGLGGLTGLLGGGSQQQSQPQPLPRVSYWGIWNEPNEGAWLNPQYRDGPHHSRIPVAPVLYRRLVDAGWSALLASGHGGDTVLIGETASGGQTTPIPFVRALYCVGGSIRPLRGTAATQIGCPSSGNPSTFVADHPGLFGSAGYAHHPYGFDEPPNVTLNSNIITLAQLPRFEAVLNRIFSAYGKQKNGGVPLYLTEFGYKTNPPNPFVRTSLSEQATWLNQGEYMTWQMPYVQALAQFLLTDEPPKTSEPRNSFAYWGTFQTGLIMRGGGFKPGYYAFRVPIWVPRPRHSSNVTIWGQLRPAVHSSVQYAVLEYERPGSSSWTQLQELQTTSPRGFLVAHVSIPGAGAIRLAWLDPSSGNVDYSRTVAIS